MGNLETTEPGAGAHQLSVVDESAAHHPGVNPVPDSPAIANRFGRTLIPGCVTSRHLGRRYTLMCGMKTAPLFRLLNQGMESMRQFIQQVLTDTRAGSPPTAGSETRVTVQVNRSRESRGGVLYDNDTIPDCSGCRVQNGP